MDDACLHCWKSLSKEIMIKGSEVLNLKVITLDSGQEIGSVKDLIYDPQQNQLLGLLINEGGWLSDARVILFEDIKNIGSNAVVVQSKDVFKNASEVSQRVSQIANDSTYLTNTKVITEYGRGIGDIIDVLFDPNTGKVSTLEVSKGGINDLRFGRIHIPTGDVLTIGDDATIVKDKSYVVIDSQAKRVIGSIKEESGKVRRSIDILSSDAVKVNVKEIAERGEGFLGKSLNQAREIFYSQIRSIRSSTENRMKRHAVGKFLTKNIILPDDTLLARRGDVVTNRLLRQAEDHNLLDEILSNVTSFPT